MNTSEPAGYGDRDCTLGEGEGLGVRSRNRASGSPLWTFSPSISDISLSDVGSHLTDLSLDTFCFWDFSWIIGKSTAPSSFFDGPVKIFFGASGFSSPGSTIPNSYPKSYLKYIKPVSGSICFFPVGLQVNIVKSNR